MQYNTKLYLFLALSIAPISQLALANQNDEYLPSQITQQQRILTKNHSLQQDLAWGFDTNLSSLTHDDYRDETKDQPCFIINQIRLSTSSDVPSSLFASVLTPLTNPSADNYALGKCIGSYNLQKIVRIAQNQLIKLGYLTSHIEVGEQDLNTGTLVLTIKPGKVDRIIFTNLDKYTPPLFIRQALPLDTDDVFLLNKLEQGLETLKKIDSTTDIQIRPARNTQRVGFSDLLIKMNQTRQFAGSFTVDDTLSKRYGTYLAQLDLSATNVMRFNDDWQFGISYPLHRGIDLIQNTPKTQLGKDYQLNYQIGLTIPVGFYKLTANHQKSHYEHYLPSFQNPLTYHGDTTTSTLGISRVLHRGNHHKTDGYLKAYHQYSDHYIDDIAIEVQSRKTAGYHLGIGHQRYLPNQGFIYANIDYRHGTAMLGAKPAPEEQVYDAFGRKLPAEGYARSPIWSWYIDYQQPFVIRHQNLVYQAKIQGQYAKRLPVSSELFYLGGRYRTKGIKEGNHLAGEHGSTLQQTLSWQLPYQSDITKTQLYTSLDQGWVRGAYTHPNQRYIITGAIGIKQQYHNLHLDAFVGKGIKTPDFINKNTVIGMSASMRF